MNNGIANVLIMSVVGIAVVILISGFSFWAVNLVKLLVGL